MSDGALRISILGDASQFTKTLDQLEKDLKGFQDKLKTATGADIPTYNIKIAGAQQSIKEITEFGKFAEGSLGRLLQLQKELEAKRLTISDPGELAQVNQKLAETANLIKEIKATGIEKPISIPIEPPPLGSINDYKKRIAELTQERNISVGLNLSNVNVRIQELRNRLNELEKQGIEIPVEPVTPVLANSIQGIKNKIDELNRKKILIDIANEGEIAEINQQLDRLNSKLAKANSVSFDKNGQITQSAGKARQAITSLSLVAQDLPFGFIAIQNNLPAVLQTFTELESKGKGLKGAFKELGGALKGPAGIFLAFSVVTAAVTYAIKEYGSLGAAIDALLGKSDALAQVTRRVAESYKEYRKNLVTTGEALAQATGAQTGQIAKAQALAGIITDLSKSEKERKTALQELQSLDKERFKNFDIEKGKYDGIKEAVDGLTNSLIANAIANKLADRASDLAIQERQATNEADKLYLRQQELLRTNIDINDEVAKYKKALKSSKSADEFFRASIGVSKFAIELLQVNDELANADLRASNLRKELAGLKVEIKGAVEEANKFSILDTPDAPKVATFALKIDTQDLDEAFNIDKIKSNVEKYGNALIDVNNTEKERKNALKELLEINPEYFKSFDLNKKRIDELRGSLESYIRTLLVEKKSREDAADASKINAQIRKNEEKGIKSLGDKYNYFADSKLSIPDNIDDAIELSEAWDKVGNSTDKATKSNNKLVESLKFGQDVIEILKKGLNLKETYNNALEDLLNFSEYSRKEIEKIAKDLRFLQDPLEGLFTTLLEDGKLSWKAFADDVIQQIKRIAAALLSKAIIQGIANILSPGAGAIVGRGLKAIDTAALEDYSNGNDWIDLFTGGNGRANFGGVRGNNAMSMAGQVNMVIRGNDLVGVMNRTNTTINRVG